MASIFKRKLLQERVKSYNIDSFEKKLLIVQKWLKSYQDGYLQNKTEKEVEQEFIQSIFVDVLEYTRFPDDPTTLIPQGKTLTSGQKPDAILGYFKHGELRDSIAAVCEIKDAKTLLDKSQKREGSLTPVQQAFKYRTQYQKCDFVIATNFFEIRLLKDNELNYESWTLETLFSPENDYFELKKFYYLLCRKNFVVERGKSTTLQLLSDIQVEQEAITKSFYKEYKDLRQKLIKNILKNNEEAKKRDRFYELAVEKAQKIIDRIVFVAFCEDLDLLPENILRKVIESDNQTFGSMWDTLKGFFSAIDKGSVKLGNPEGYNGELFKPDPDLDKLVIDDEICREFTNIGKYDFSEDLSVNILGHIFEQSISDLEELKTIGTENEVDKGKSKRKKDGIFYTPEYIVDYIVQNSVGTWLKERESEILKKYRVTEKLKDANYEKRYKDAYIEYQSVLQDIKVLDPACGSGAFLVRVFDYLLEENRRVGDIVGGLFSNDPIFKSILQNNIYGVDLNNESVEITKLSLWLKTAQKGKKLASLDQNIKCGNSLIDDPAIAGDKAFKWDEEFKEIMGGGGFDVVVGNPPYVRQEMLGEFKPYFKQNYKCFSGTTDLFAYFYEKGLSLLRGNGLLSYISNSFAKTTGAGVVLRKYIQENAKIEKIIDFGTVQIFSGATTYPVIFVLRKTQPKGMFSYLSVQKEDLSTLESAFLEKSFLIKQQNLNSESWVFEDEVSKKLRSKLAKLPNIKEIYGKCYYGVKTGLNEAFVIDEIIKRELLALDSKSIELIKPFWEGKDISRWHSAINDKYIIAIPNGYSKKNYGENVSEEVMTQAFPAIMGHLTKHKEKAQKRYDQGDYWWELRACDYYELFEKPKITWPNLQSNGKFCFDDTGKYINAPAVILPTYDKALLGIINSSLVWFFLKRICVERSGGYLEVKPQYFSQIPIPRQLNGSKKLVKKVEQVISLTASMNQKTSRLQTLLMKEYKLDRLSKKAHSFWELEFDDLVKELKLKKLSLIEKDGLFQIWEKYASEVRGIELQINSIEKEIDDIVFGFYNLAEQEKSTVLGNTQ